MQNIVIVWRASSIYLVGAGAGTGVSKTRASRGPALLGAGVLYSESLSSSGSLYSAERSGLLQVQKLGAIAAERSLVSSNKASLNGLADPLSLEKLDL